MVDICRVIMSRAAASHSDLPAPNVPVSARGVALLHVEFLTLQPVEVCVFTMPIAHTALLQFLFPDLHMHIYGCLLQERYGNVWMHSETFTEGTATLWRAEPHCGFIPCGEESAARQLIWCLKMQACCSLLCLHEAPEEFVGGTLMLPVWCPQSCTCAFLIHVRGAQTCCHYDARILQRQVLHFQETRRGDDVYDMDVETFLLSQACRKKGVGDQVVAAVAHLAAGLLPGIKKSVNVCS